ncbi:MAG: hypothetical protein LBV67_06740 [Streptococcaceae bacterium]|jgi:hypothetical protein|nr:hypothetical protein [Streptococcaceae bacterium]
MAFIHFDPVFLETIEKSHQYHVFLTVTNDKKYSHIEKHPTYFIVYGENGLEFDWFINAKQKDYADVYGDQVYLEEPDAHDEPELSNDIPKGNVLEDDAQLYLEKFEQEIYNDD